MTAISTQWLDLEGGTLAYDDVGDKGSPTLICIPGMGDLRSQYRRIRPILLDAGLRVVTIDVRGFGDTDAAWDDYSASAISRDLIALMDYLKITSAFIAGNSFAAGSAVWAARESSSRIRGVIMLGPIVRDLPVSWMLRMVLKLGFSGPWRSWFWMTYWDSLFTLEKPSDHSENKAQLRENLSESLRMDALWSMINLSKADTEGILDSHSKPTLIVMGTKDPDFSDPTAEATMLAKRMRTQAPVLVQDAGHYPHVEAPDQVSRAIIDFMSRY